MKGKRIAAWLCALALGVTPFSGTGLVLAGESAASPTAWWKMDETEGDVAADAAGTADATVVGGKWSAGVLGGALDLSGYGEYAILKDYPKPTTTATYSAWVFMREHTPHEAILKNWDGDTYGQLELGLNNTSGRLWAQVAQADGGQVSVTDPEVFPLNAWTLVTVTMDGSRVTLYKNGVAVGSCSYNGTLKTDFAPLGIGTKPNSAGTAPDKDWPCYLNGKIDDVRVYDKALPAEEIAAMCRAVQLQSLTIKTVGKNAYRTGDVWDATGLTLTAAYADGSTQEIPGADCTVTGFDTTTEGEKTVTLSYTVGTETRTANMTVTVEKSAQTGGEEGSTLDLSLPLQVREATEWTQMFDRRQGWVGSDGIFSFNLSGVDAIGSADENTKTFFIFSDTLAGSVNEENLSISAGPMMNHSAGLLTGGEPGFDSIEFYYGSRGDMTCTNIFGDNYWLMDGVVIGDFVYVVAIRVGGDWRVRSLDLVKIPIVEDENGERGVDLQNFTIIENMPILHWKGEYSVVFGNGIMPNTVEAGVPADMADGYIYVYGYRMDTSYHSELLVARVLPEEFENGAAWRFWNGRAWVQGVANVNNDAAVIMPNPVSNEASVTPITSGIYAGKYMAVYCRSGQNRTMEYAIADSPVGPFSEGVAFFDAPEAEEYPYRAYSYNAKAHPHLSPEGKLLVTYNVNNPDIWSQTNQIYRSRWLELDLNTLAAQPVLGDVSSHQHTSASGYIDNDSAPRFGADGGYWQRSWKDDTPGDKWLQIDLGRVKYIRRYILRNAGWGDGKASAANTRDWIFQVSLDGETWTDVDAVTGNTADKVIRDFDEVPARYVRMYITKPSQTDSDVATVTSIEVYGTPISVPKDTRVNVARGQSVTVSGGEDTADMLVNGQYDSVRDRWIDDTPGDKWAVVDLGGSYEISKYIVRHAGVREETRLNTNAFRLEASDDGVTWRTVDRVDYNMHSVTEREVSPFTARYVRLYITKATLSNVDVARIYSLELYSDLSADAAWWPLDGAVADAVGDNDAVLQGGTEWRDGALAFDGKSGMVLVADYPKPTATATYSAWVRAEELGAWRTILKNWGVDSHGQISLGLSEDGQYLAADVVQANGIICKLQNDTEFPTGEWVHVALTADGDTLTLYQNGEAVAQTAYDGTLKAVGYPFLGIGAKPNDTGTAPAESSAGYWSGAIADVRVYTRALSAAELREIIGRPIEVEAMGERNVYAGVTLADLALPETVQVRYSNNTWKDFPVTWDTAALDLGRVGTYTVAGTYNRTEQCTLTVRVRGNYEKPDIAWWKLDETAGSTAEDATDNGADALVQRGGSWAPAKWGNGLEFASTGGFALVKDYQKPTTTATYSAWIYMNEYTTYATVIKNWGMDKHGQISLGLLESGGQMAVTFTQANGGMASVTDPNQFPLKQWTLVTAVADGEYIVLYINDREVGRSAYDGTLKASGYDALGLGAKPNDAGTGVAGSSQGYLNGCVDDVRVYSWDLTAEDVAKLYAGVQESYRTSLGQLIAEAEAQREAAEYAALPEETRQTLETALGRAQEAYADAGLTQTEIDGIARALQEALPFEMTLSLCGDVDGDGRVTTTDARLVLQYVVGKVAGAELNLSVADVDGDGDITTTDARLILQYVVQKIPALPVGGQLL